MRSFNFESTSFQSKEAAILVGGKSAVVSASLFYLLTVFFVQAIFLVQFFAFGVVAVAQSSNAASGLGSGNSGVWIDAFGVLEVITIDDGKLAAKQLDAARKSYSQLSQSVMQKSKLRFISLKQLERAFVNVQGVPTEEMRFLAGLTRVKYLFYFPDSQEIVIAGPAEGWYPGPEGMMVGRTTGTPICELQDLVVALRAFAPNKEPVDVVGCSIDPTSEGNANLQRYLKSNRPDQNRLNVFVEGLQRSLGLQTIRVDGVPSTTHAARVMVAADYRMKLIGIGLEKKPSGVNITTFIAKSSLSPQSINRLHRWYFVPDYHSVIMSADKTGIELVGDGVKLVTEEEVVDAITGKRTATKNASDNASLEFTRSFTSQYPKIAKKLLVYAQLRNFIDMLVCAAHIQREDFYTKSEWTMDVFGNEDKYAVQTYQMPKYVLPAVNYKFENGRIGFPIGGVEIEPTAALSKENAKFENETKKPITQLQNKIKIELKPDQWWWD
ncbi:MAG: DUF1598 domain-containing protein [Planctomycetaceae bacterium]|jgi:hypothetical protein|nr:DUF1598 domain-containing protein [Planctomycetaceae bacterium]